MQKYRDMDYKYIEQLVERYWQCQTSVEEEAILKAFFSLPHVPEHLQAYKAWFNGEKLLQESKLGGDFDARLLARIENEDVVVKARRMTWPKRLMPLYKAAAALAIIFTLGNAAQTSFRHPSGAGSDYNYESYKDSYDDPAMAYDQVSDALQMVSQSLSEAARQDSLLQSSAASDELKKQ